MPELRIALLGTPHIEVDGAPIAVDTRKAIALLALLGAADGPRSRDELALLLWPDYDESHGRSSLRRTLSTLRSALAGRWLRADRDLVTLEAEDVWCDLAQFRGLITSARTHEAHREPCDVCLDRLAEAVRLYRGDFMSGFTLRDSPEFEEWQLLQAEHLRRELDQILERLVRGELARSDTATAQAYARRRLDLDPLNEAAHSTLMQLYALAGDRSAALRQYRDCLRVLDEELGVAPLEETTRLYESVVAGEVEPPPALPLPGIRAADPAAPSRPRPLAELPLVGRERAYAALDQAYGSVQPDGRLIVVEGEAGVGKTRLVRELLDSVRRRGGTVLTAQCYEGEVNVAYGPVAALLRAAISRSDAAEVLRRVAPHDLAEAIRIAPDLAQLVPALPDAPPLESPAARSRFLEGVCAVLAGVTSRAVPGAILVDDLHWADDSSVELLMYLARRLADRPLCLVVTWRSEEVPAGHRLRRFLAERSRAGDVTHLELARLDRADIEQLIAALPFDDPGGDIGERLYRETEGLPFFVAQYLATLPADEEGVDWAVPQTVRELLRARVARVGDADMQLLTTAAVIGRSFDFDTLRDASGRSEDETVAAVERLLGDGLFRLAAEGGARASYDFSHERLRAYIYEEASPARRRLLHRRVAEALARDRHRTPGAASSIGYHFSLAGRDDEAAGYFEEAGHYARTLHANTEALAHFRAALASGHPHPAQLHEEIGGLLTLGGDYGAALASYQTAAALATAGRLPTIEHQIGLLYLRLGAWALAEEHLAAAFAGFIAGAQDGDRARALADRSLAAHRAGREADAAGLAGRSLDLAVAADDGHALAQSHNILGMFAGSRGDHALALEHLRLSLSIAERLDSIDARIAALNNLALALASRGATDEAQQLLRTALALCTTQGDRHREAALRNNLADLLRSAGNAEESMAQLKQAVALFAEIGADREDSEPEIWKLVNW